MPTDHKESELANARFDTVRARLIKLAVAWGAASARH